MEAVRTAGIEDQKMYYEAYFIYAMMWSIGGAVADDKIANYRKFFSSWIRGTAKNPKMPDNGEAFDYRYEPSTQQWMPKLQMNGHYKTKMNCYLCFF